MSEEFQFIIFLCAGKVFFTTHGLWSLKYFGGPLLQKLTLWRFSVRNRTCVAHNILSRFSAHLTCSAVCPGMNEWFYGAEEFGARHSTPLIRNNLRFFCTGVEVSNDFGGVLCVLFCFALCTK